MKEQSPHDTYRLFLDAQSVGSLFNEESWSEMPSDVQQSILEATNARTREEAYANFMAQMQQLQRVASDNYPFIKRS